MSRGRCGACGVGFSVTSKGLIRAHQSSHGQDGRWGRCLGAGMPPIEADEPLLGQQMRELHDEVTRLRRENTALRHAWQAEKHRSEAHRLHAEAMGIWRDLAATAMKAAEREMDASSAEWDARIALLTGHAELTAQGRVIDQ